MPSQADFEKVKRCIIEPIQKLFNCEINVFTIEGLIEDIHNYSEEVLNLAIKHIRQHCKSAPKIAHIYEACEWAVKQIPVNVEKRFEKKEDRQYPETADMVMKSEFGQIAIREGWATDLYLKTFQTGKSDWSYSDAQDFRASLQQAINDATEFDKARQPRTAEERRMFGIAIDPDIAAIGLRFWHSRQRRELELASKYGKAA